MGPIKTRQIVSALETKGFRCDNKDHRYFIYYRSDRRTCVKTKVSHGRASKDIGSGLLAAIRRQMHLMGSELDDFVDCPIGQAEYESLLVDRGILQPPAPESK